MMRQNRQFESLTLAPGTHDSIQPSGLSACLCLSRLRGKFDEGIRLYVPGAFKRIIQIRENEMSEEQKHGCEYHRDHPE